MSTDNATSMALTGVSSGLSMSSTASSGTIVTNSSIAGQAGYAIESKMTGNGVPYNVITVNGETGKDDPASVVVTVNYVQNESFGEVELEVRWTDIPDGTDMQLESSQSKFDLSKRSIEGSSNYSVTGTDLGSIKAIMATKLWITQPDQLKSTSNFQLSMSHLDGGGGGSVKKVLLEQVVIGLKS